MASGGTLWGALGASDGVVKAANNAFESKPNEFAHSSGSSPPGDDHIRRVLSNDINENIEASLPEVTQLARRFTALSQQQSRGEYINTFLGSDNATLDPHSGKFNARKWVENLVGLVSRDPERYPSRTAGVSFRNLNVHGFGTTTDYQKTFGNYPLEIGTI